MKYWQAVAMIDMDELPEIARRAEEFGFEGLVFGDHLLSHKIPHGLGDGHRVTWNDAVHWPDVWVQIAALSAMTTTLKFMTGVYVLPLRDPFSAAKAISTAAVLSDNRVIAGIGVGWERREFEAVGQCFEDRGARTDEMLVVIKKLLSGATASHQGVYYRFSDVRMFPGPSVQPPIYGGGMSVAALRRAAFNDGWIGGLLHIDEIAPLLHTLKEQRALAHRTHLPFDAVTAIQHFDERKLAQAAELGVSGIINLAWVNEAGQRLDLPLVEKVQLMRDFAQRFIR